MGSQDAGIILLKISYTIPSPRASMASEAHSNGRLFATQNDFKKSFKTSTSKSIHRLHDSFPFFQLLIQCHILSSFFISFCIFRNLLSDLEIWHFCCFLVSWPLLSYETLLNGSNTTTLTLTKPLKIVYMSGCGFDLSFFLYRFRHLF